VRPARSTDVPLLSAISVNEGADARCGRPRGVTTNEHRSVSYQRLRRELLDAERDAVLDLRRSGAIADDVMHRVLRDIALEDARLDFER
jgi:hypothetical protein